MSTPRYHAHPRLFIQAAGTVKEAINSADYAGHVAPPGASLEEAYWLLTFARNWVTAMTLQWLPRRGAPLP